MQGNDSKSGGRPYSCACAAVLLSSCVEEVDLAQPFPNL